MDTEQLEQAMTGRSLFPAPFESRTSPDTNLSKPPQKHAKNVPKASHDGTNHLFSCSIFSVALSEIASPVS